jgi:hypothetical protein
MKQLNVDKINCQITKAQKALIDWGMEHPHSKRKELEFVDGQPMKRVVVTEDGLGTELVRFDKMIDMKKR